MTADKIAGAPLTEEQYFLVPDDVEEIEIVNAEYFNK
jgi:hypothetical protein